MPVFLIQQDITRLQVDAIVNAANRSLMGGGGVDGAIHRAAGKQLLEECIRLQGCETGDAKITRGYLLPSRFVIHTVGPVWHGGNNKEENLLKSAYLRSLEVARENNIKSIAFPNISTGIYRFPKEKAARIAIQTVQQFLQQYPLPKDVYFVCFDEENYHIYQKILQL
jgi:O-acetyl-ADP-ribose deacetylase (regulator of RNase III)